MMPLTGSRNEGTYSFTCRQASIGTPSRHSPRNLRSTNQQLDPTARTPRISHDVWLATTNGLVYVEDTGSAWGKTCARVSQDGLAVIVALGAQLLATESLTTIHQYATVTGSAHMKTTATAPPDFQDSSANTKTRCRAMDSAQMI